jgi:hypothetical protein
VSAHDETTTHCVTSVFFQAKRTEEITEGESRAEIYSWDTTTFPMVYYLRIVATDAPSTLLL